MKHCQLEKIVHAGIFLPLRGFDKQGRYALLIRAGQVRSFIVFYCHFRHHDQSYNTTKEDIYALLKRAGRVTRLG